MSVNERCSVHIFGKLTEPICVRGAGHNGLHSTASGIEWGVDGEQAQAEFNSAAVDLLSVEWEDYEYDGVTYRICPWCSAQKDNPDNDHRDGCVRQKAFAAAVALGLIDEDGK